MGPFSVFASTPEAHEKDREVTALISLLLDGAPLVTLQRYRRLYGMIACNAQSVHPVSRLHVRLAEASDAERRALAAVLAPGAAPEPAMDELFRLEMLQRLTCKGQAMLEIGNCMNHSCFPNVVASCGHPDHRIQYVALRQIRPGDEITRAYLDFSSRTPLAERQTLLRQHYQFDCHCLRCQSEQTHHASHQKRDKEKGDQSKNREIC